MQKFIVINIHNDMMFQTLTKLEYTFVNCSKNISAAIQHQPDATEYETYYEKEMVIYYYHLNGYLTVSIMCASGGGLRGSFEPLFHENFIFMENFGRYILDTAFTLNTRIAYS